jgi:hypothetical protein
LTLALRQREHALTGRLTRRRGWVVSTIGAQVDVVGCRRYRGCGVVM